MRVDCSSFTVHVIGYLVSVIVPFVFTVTVFVRSIRGPDSTDLVSVETITELVLKKEENDELQDMDNENNLNL